MHIVRTLAITPMQEVRNSPAALLALPQHLEWSR